MASSPARRLGATAAVLAAVLISLGLGPDAAGGQPAGGLRTQAGLDCVTGEGEVATSSVLVVVAFPSGTYTRCVAAGGSGLEVLRAAGLSVEVASSGGLGGAVCAITDPQGTFVGCAAGPDCLKSCEASNGGTRYWAYYRCYAYSPTGAGSTRPAGGTVEGWGYGGGGSWRHSRPADCDDGRAEPPPTTPTTPATPPPGAGSPGGSPGGEPSGGGSPDASGTTPTPGGGAGPTTPDGSPAAPGAPAGPGASTTAPATTAPGASTTTTAEGSTTTDADGADDRGPARWDPSDGDGEDGDEADDGEQAAGIPTSASSDADGGGGGAPVAPLAGTALVVGGVAALALRARRSRSAA